MSSIQELRQEANKVINETHDGGNSASRIGNLYNGIIDFLGVLDDRTLHPSTYDDTALREAIARVNAAIADLDSLIASAVAIATHERDRLDELLNTLDGEITDKVTDMLDDAQWLEDHAKGIQEMVNEGDVFWKSEWNNNVGQYLQEAGVWAREGDVIKTQWTSVVQSVSEITNTVAEVQQDLAGRPTSTQWSQISQKVNGIEQTVNALLYRGDVTEALQSSINQSIDNKVARLNLETTYASIDTEGSKKIIEWMYSALRNETTPKKTFNDLVSAGESGLLNGISNVHTYVEVVRNGEVLEHVAGAAIEAKVNDAVTGLYSKATDHDATTTIFSQVKKDTSDIAAIVVGATGDSSSASIATKFATWKSGLVIKSELESASASLITAMDAKDNEVANASALLLQTSIENATADIITRVGGMTAGFLLKSDLGSAMAQMVAADTDSGAVAAIVAKVNRSGSEIMLSADQITMTNAFANSITANQAFIGYLTGGSATFDGHIKARSLELGSDISISQSNVNGLESSLTSLENDIDGVDQDVQIVATALAGKANTSDLPKKVSDLTDDISIITADKVSVGQTTTDENGIKSRTITVGNTEYTEIINDDFVIFGKSKGRDDEGYNFFKVDSNGLLKARNAWVYGTIYATDGVFFGDVKARSLELGDSVTISQNKVSGLTTDLGKKANSSDLSAVATSGKYSDLTGKPSIPKAISDLTGATGILYADDVTVGTQTTANGLTKRTITVGDNSFTEVEGGDFVLTNIGIGNGESDPTSTTKHFIKVSKNGLLTAHNAIIYGSIYATNGYFAGELKASTITGNIQAGSGNNKITIRPATNNGAELAGICSGRDVISLGFSDSNAARLIISDGYDKNYTKIDAGSIWCTGYWGQQISANAYNVYTSYSNLYFSLGSNGGLTVGVASSGKVNISGKNWPGSSDVATGALYKDSNGFLKVK